MQLAQINFGESENAFPLTPALSLGERGNPAPSQGMMSGGIRAFVTRRIKNVQTLFPLPGGEGQGEGKLTNTLSKIKFVP